MFRQVWIGGKKSTGYWNLNKFQNLKLLKKNDVFLYFCREIGSDLDTRSPIDFGSALDIWVSASSSWTLDGFRLSVFGRLILFRLLVLGRLLLISAFGSWMFWLSVLGSLIYKFWLSISAFSSWAFDIVIGCNILGLWIGNGCDISLGFGSVSTAISP
ncbi:unnamed protein product [Rhizophagus irregularis]|uniref:Uncharacterized protein n=1 Tax=Rhizophagus irregularis TaxID=588596 RepID=A0A915ZQT3_9GLOM|nr:unnamed protein product [Rhizophagus irregularis]